MAMKEKITKKIDQIAAELACTSLSCLKRYPDGRTEFYTTGYASLEKNKKTNSQTIFRIASISKIEIALAYMKLVEMGQADPDEDISIPLGYTVRNPYFPNDKITAGMLMTQSTSIMDGDDDDNPQYTDGKGYDGTNGKSMYVSLERLLTDPSYEYYTDRIWSHYKPGTHFYYSNFGCGILACIVEKISHMSYNDFLKKILFKPLNIDASYRADTIQKKALMADYYEVYKKDNTITHQLTRTAESFVTGVYPKHTLGDNYRGPAGGLFISLMDLSKIMSLFLNKGTFEGQRLFKEDTIEKMLRAHFVNCDLEEKQLDYRAKGYQLKITDTLGRPLYGHTGGAYGIISAMFFDPRSGYGYEMITNGCLSGQRTMPEWSTVIEKTLKALMEEDHQDNKFISSLNLATQELTTFHGTYTLKPLSEGVYSLVDMLDIIRMVPVVQGDKITFMEDGTIKYAVGRENYPAINCNLKDVLASLKHRKVTLKDHILYIEEC